MSNVIQNPHGVESVYVRAAKQLTKQFSTLTNRLEELN